jgi:hypothetical protein
MAVILTPPQRRFNVAALPGRQRHRSRRRPTGSEPTRPTHRPGRTRAGDTSVRLLASVSQVDRHDSNGRAGGVPPGARARLATAIEGKQSPRRRAGGAGMSTAWSNDAAAVQVAKTGKVTRPRKRHSGGRDCGPGRLGRFGDGARSIPRTPDRCGVSEGFPRSGMLGLPLWKRDRTQEVAGSSPASSIATETRS